MKALGNIAMLALFLVVMGALGVALDDHDDARAEWAKANSLGATQRQAAEEARRDLAAARICRQAHGEATFTWNHRGELVCIPRRGHAITAGWMQ